MSALPPPPAGLNRQLLFRWAIFLLGAGLIVTVFVVYVGNQVADFDDETKAEKEHLIKNAEKLRVAMAAYALAHEGSFPAMKSDGSPMTDSNEAFRRLVADGFLTDETVCHIPGNPFCRTRPPDGNLGSAADGFAAALAPGENAYAYVTGLNAKTSSTETPLVFEAPLPRNAITARGEQSFLGRYRVVVTIGGDARLVKADEDGVFRREIGGKFESLFSPAFGVDASHVLEPTNWK